MSDFAIGIIDASSYEESLHDLTVHRSHAALPFMGRYRLIDFPLSNLVHSGITNIAVITKYHHRSLFDHLRSGKNWDLDRKNGGLYIFPNPSYLEAERPFSLRMLQFQCDYLLKCSEPYVILANVLHIGNINYREIIRFHHETGGNITGVTKGGEYLQLYIINREFLLNIINNLQNHYYETVHEVFLEQVAEQKGRVFEYEGYIANVMTLSDYYLESMKLLDYENFRELFLPNRPILTKVKDEPSAQYLDHAKVNNCIVGNGCVINGTVENSILFRGVHIEEGAVVKNSILMQRCVVEKGAKIENLVIDKEGTIPQGKNLSPEHPLVILKSNLQGDVIER